MITLYLMGLYGVPPISILQGDHLELSQKLLMITFKEKRICQAAILHIVDVFSPFDNNTPTSSNKLLLNVH